MGKADMFLSAVGAGFLLLLLLLVAHPRLDARDFDSRTARGRELVARLGLTDLSLFTEARYTRHPSQADLHSAFQDHPGALEHFPSGSFISPPEAW